MNNKNLSKKEASDVKTEVQIVSEVIKLCCQFRKEWVASCRFMPQHTELNDRTWALLRQLDNRYNPGYEPRSEKEILKMFDLWLFVRGYPEMFSIFCLSDEGKLRIVPLEVEVKIA